MKRIVSILLLYLSLCVVTIQSRGQIENGKDYSRSYEIGATEGFCELVSYGVKQLGLGVPMRPAEMDKFLPFAEEVAKKHNVKLYRETDLIDTDLFTRGIAKGYDVLLIYTGTTLTQYLDLKNDRNKLEEDGLYTGMAREMIARRFGRLLSYTPRTINNQLTQHTDFRTMYSFGIQAINVSFYYKNLGTAKNFYTKILGLEIIEDNGSSVIVKMADDSFLTLIDAREGIPYSDKPKTVALALVTDQIAEWSAYLNKQDVEIKHDYKPAEGKAHNSMVVVDPEGYLLEFERFNQHPENEKFFSMIKHNKVIYPDVKNDVKLNLNSSITWLYYKNLLPIQNFYQDVLGLELVIDQGWCKIYKSSETGFIGLVDEMRGMHKFSEEKAVNVSFILEDTEGWLEYVKKNNPLKIHSETPFVGIDPGEYHMRFLSKME